MTLFIFIAVVSLVAVAVVVRRYSRQRYSDTYDPEGTRKATSGGGGHGVLPPGKGSAR